MQGQLPLNRQETSPTTRGISRRVDQKISFSLPSDSVSQTFLDNLSVSHYMRDFLEKYGIKCTNADEKRCVQWIAPPSIRFLDLYNEQASDHSRAIAPYSYSLFLVNHLIPR